MPEKSFNPIDNIDNRALIDSFCLFDTLYITAFFDGNIEGIDYDKLPESWVIFITENDVIGKNKPLYHIERVIMDGGELFGDDSHILYVNGACRDNTPLGKLMHDFACTNADQMYYNRLAERTRYFKESNVGAFRAT